MPTPRRPRFDALRLGYQTGMEIGGFFLILVLLIVLGVLGFGFYALTMWLRGKQLHPEGDKVEGSSREPERPEHVEVESEQRTRFVGSR